MACALQPLALTPAGAAQQATPTLRARLWQPTELSLRTTTLPSAPFELPVSVVCRASDGKVMEIPAYYDGECLYRVRFNPPAAGNWSLTSKSMQADLNGLTWNVEVSPDTGDRLSPLEISPRDAIRFGRKGGGDVSLLAFECDWLWALDYGDPALPRVRRFLEEVAKNGFNQIVLNVYAHDVRWPKDPNVAPRHLFTPPPAWPFGGNNSAPDHSKLNLEFFRHYDRLIALLDELNLSAHIMIYVWNKEVNWPAARSVEDNRYFDYVVKRYQGFPNVVWDISKEALGYGHNDMGYITERIDRLRALDAHRRLVTVHDYLYCNHHPDKVDFISVQEWGTNLHAKMGEIFAKHKGKPIFNIEHGGYERGPHDIFGGAYEDPVACLDRNYACLFAGCDSTYYWQDSSWNVLIWDPWTLPEKDRPHWQYFRHMRALINAVNLPALRPDEKGSSSGYCLSDGKDVFVVYAPGTNVRVNVTGKATTGGKFTSQWFDPITGKFGLIETIESMKFWHAFRVPLQGNPAVLILRRMTPSS